MSQFNVTHLQPAFQHQIMLAEEKLAAAKDTTGEIQEKETLADLLEQFGLHDESRLLFHQLANQAVQPLMKARLHRKITQSYINQRDHETAALTAKKTLAIIRQTALSSSEEKTEYFSILVQSCSAFYFNMESEKVEECVKELRRLFSPDTNLKQQIDFYYSVCLDLLQKYRWYQLPEEAVSHCQFYRHLASQTGNEVTIAMAKTVSGFVHLLREEIPESRVLFNEAIEILAEKNYGFLLICYTYMSLGYRMQNNISMTELWTNLTTEKAEKSGNKLYMGTSYGNLAWVYAKRGNWLYAEDYSRKALDQMMTVSPLYYLAIFPLIDVLIKKDALEEAAQYVFLLLHPKAKKFPDTLTERMKECTTAWLNDDIETTKTLLKNIISEAKTTGYY